MHTKQIIMYDSSKAKKDNIANKEAKKYKSGYLFVSDISNANVPLSKTKIRIDWFSKDSEMINIINHAITLCRLASKSRVSFYEIKPLSPLTFRFYKQLLSNGTTIYADDISYKLNDYLKSSRKEK